MRDLVLISAVVGGGYLLVKYLQGELGAVGWGPSPEGNGQDVRDGTGVENQAGTGGQMDTKEEAPLPKEWDTPPPGSAMEQAIVQAANNPVFANTVSGIRLNSDQWNYYRALGGGDVPSVDLFPEEDRGYGMTAQEYHMARSRKGLGRLGLGQTLGPGQANVWELSSKKWMVM